jgi:hypothetical protein
VGWLFLGRHQSHMQLFDQSPVHLAVGLAVRVGPFSPTACAMRYGQFAEFLIEVDQILAALVVQGFEDKSSQFVVAHELNYCLSVHPLSRAGMQVPVQLEPRAGSWIS